MNATLQILRFAVVFTALAAPSLALAQPVTVSFTNPGLAAQTIFRYDTQRNAESYFGALPGGVTTPPIATSPGEVWRVRLTGNQRLVGEYVVTAQPVQVYELQGFLPTAEEPARSNLQVMADDLTRAIVQTWQSLPPSVTQPVNSTVKSVVVSIDGAGKLAERVRKEFLAHEREISLLFEWYATTGRFIDAGTVQRLVEGRKGSELAALVRLDELKAKLGSSAGPSAPQEFGVHPASLVATDPASDGLRLVSVGAAASGSLLAGGSAEIGAVWESRVGNPLPLFFYGSTATGFGVSGGASVALSIGLWEVDPAQFVGQATSIGFALDMGYGGGVALWFACEPGGTSIDPRIGTSCPMTESSRYIGATFQPGVGLAFTMFQLSTAETTAL